MTTTYRVTIEPAGIELQVNDNETILEAALKAGIDFPHHCRSAVCGTCQADLLEGQIEYSDLVPPLAEPKIFTCQAKPRSVLTLHVDGLNSEAQQIETKILHVASIAPDIYCITLKPTQAFHYLAGQYLEILTETQAFPFSIANAPETGSGTLDLHWRYDSAIAGQQFLKAIFQEGKSLMIRGPFGESTLKNKPSIIVAGGTGYAPARALIESAFIQNLHQTIYLYCGARHFNLLYGHKECQKWAKYIPYFHYLPVLSESTPKNWTGEKSLVHNAMLSHQHKLSDFNVYAFGPFEMVLQTKSACLKEGLKKEQFFSDY